MEIKNNKKKGSITVYLALIFGVMIILIAAVISLLRYESEQVNMQRTLDISVESAFGKYFRPLLDDYGLFYYIETDEEALSADVMSYFKKNQEHTHSFLELTAGSLTVSDKAYAVNDECKNVKKQMIAAGKYACGEEAVDKLMEQMNEYYGRQEHINESVKGAVADIDSIKEDAVCEEKILKLLSLIDGVAISGADITKVQHFVKEGLKGEATQNNAGIDCNAVWNCVKGECFDIGNMLDKLKEKSKKGASGKNVYLPKEQIKDWIKRLKNIKAVTETAYEICGELDLQMSEDVKKEAICNVSGIKRKLLNNISILDELVKLADYGEITGQDSWNNYGVYIDSLINSLSGYHVQDLTFDYSSYNPENVSDPTEAVDMNVSGILSLLLDSERELSSKALKESDVYENSADSNGTKGNSGISSKKDYRDTENIGDVLSDCVIDSAADKAVELACLSMYINSYFDCFVTESEADAIKALLYEREYIVGGKQSDADNLKSVANRLLLIRTGENFIYFITDKGQSMKAYQTAAALVGFTGMEALVRVTQYIILTGWAYAEACVDVSGLLNGKKISLYKSKKTLNIAYHELPQFSRSLIKEKTGQMSLKHGVGYEECLWILVGSTGSNRCIFRSMDIIHYTMKLRYYKKFSFNNALYGAGFDLTVSGPFYSECKAAFSY